MVGVAAAVAVAGSAMAAVVDPFTVASSATDSNLTPTVTAITGGLWDTRVTALDYRTNRATASMVVDSFTNAATFTVTRVGTANTQTYQAADFEYENVAGVTDVSNFTSLTFNYTSTFSSLQFTFNLDGKTAIKTISASAGGTFTLNAAELNGAFDGIGYMKLQFRQSSSNASGTFTMTNLVANGISVPAPGAAALIGLAGLVASRRRRN
jgi:MYXO-CTERM domain-containing protein